MFIEQCSPNIYLKSTLRKTLTKLSCGSPGDKLTTMSTTHPTPAATHARKPRGQGHERRAEILAAAKAMFLAEGYEGFTTRKLAERVGLSQTGLYVYFKNREEIFEALSEATFELLIKPYRDVRPVTDARRRLRELIETYVSFGLSNPDEYRLTFMIGPGPAEPHPAQTETPGEEIGIARQTFRALRDNIAAIDAAGLLRSADVTLAAYAVWFAAHGLVSILIARPGYVKHPPPELIDSVASALADGLCKP
jgi:AcrR family transcriptional regulator